MFSSIMKEKSIDEREISNWFLTMKQVNKAHENAQDTDNFLSRRSVKHPNWT
jgi:hypothetical protein